MSASSIKQRTDSITNLGNPNPAETLRIVTQQKWLTRHGRPVSKALSKAERSQYQKCFDMIDSDHGGSLTADEIHKVLTAFGDKVSLADVRQAVSQNNTRRSDSISYLDFEEIITSQEQAANPNEKTKHSKLRPQSFGPRLQMLATAYRRRQMVDGTMTNKDDWRNNFLDQKHEEGEQSNRAKKQETANLSLKCLAVLERKKMFGTLKLPSSKNENSPIGSRSPTSPGGGVRSPTTISPRAQDEQPLLFKTRSKEEWEGKVCVAFGSTIRPYQFLSEEELYGDSPDTSMGNVPQSQENEWLKASGSLRFTPTGAEMYKWWETVKSKKHIHKRMTRTFGELPKGFTQGTEESPKPNHTTIPDKLILSQSTQSRPFNTSGQTLRHEFRPAYKKQQQKLAAIAALQ